MILLIIQLAVIGFFVWLVTTKIPMPDIIKYLIYFIVVIFVLYILYPLIAQYDIPLRGR